MWVLSVTIIIPFIRLVRNGVTKLCEYAGEKRVLNSELWHACAGPLVSLPAVGSRVVYFPQGHSEQVGVFCFPLPPFVGSVI